MSNQLKMGIPVKYALAAATSGGSQNFLGARWVSASLKLVPASEKRSLALRYLALSPHYFFRTKANARLSTQDFLEFEFHRNQNSRKLITDSLLLKYLEPGFTCLDYGCGPGFLAQAVAPKVAKVIACDISGGVLACAKTINSGRNIDYRQIGPNGTVPVADGAVDLVYSFAVVQHVTDDVFKGILSELRRTLRPSGTVDCHVVVDGQPGWMPEAQVRADRTVEGRLKWRFGLHGFSRSRESLEKLVANAGFKVVQIVPIADLGVDLAGDDIAGQHLCVFTPEFTAVRLKVK
jgi:SAM-dependent methyltransferase